MLKDNLKRYARNNGFKSFNKSSFNYLGYSFRALEYKPNHYYYKAFKLNRQGHIMEEVTEHLTIKVKFYKKLDIGWAFYVNDPEDFKKIIKALKNIVE